jgi:predicted RND superfamily exporter protein
MARRPGRIAVVAALVCAVLAAGFARFATDAGPDLLVGQSSQAKQVYDRFSANFGSDPIVIVMAAQNPTALYLERNLLRLGALEADIARDPRVATVLGPGTIAGSAQHAAAGEVTRVRDEYPYFVAETALASAVQQGERDPGKLSTIESNAFQAAQVAMAADVVKATQDADQARNDYSQHIDQHQSDPVLRGREQAAEAAAAKVPPPPLFSQYLAGPTGKADDAAAQQLFSRLTAGFGDCSDDIASVLHINATCQVFLERLLLDLPGCPAATTHQFCAPKSQWSAVLPKPGGGGPSYAVITVRLKPEVVGNADKVNGLVGMIRSELQKGRPNDQSAVIKSLGGFAPTECGTPDTSNNQQPSACQQRYKDAPAAYTIAGAPLLVQGVATTMTHLLLALFPIAFLVMLLLLLGSFRARGRMWPLVAAGGATLVTVGGALLIGVPISPAVLAGVPVLVGLGVDYAVQLLARFNEERDRGLGLEAALRVTLANTGPATLVAGTATLAGVAALAILTGIDLGPLAAVPLVAEFALVLCAGVIFSWLAAVFLALPAAAWRERRLERAGRLAPVAASAVAAADAPRPAVRTAALATRWRAVLVPTVVLGLLGWALMPRVPIETGVEQLLAPSLTELTDINQVRNALGYNNEIDFAVEGDLVGQSPATAVPDSVAWMGEAGRAAICGHRGQVALEVTIGDVFAGTASGGAIDCTPTTPRQVPGASPSPSPSPGATPAASASPAAATSPSPSARRTDGDIVRTGNVVAQEAASPSAAPSATAAPTAAPSPSSGGAQPTPAATPSISSPSASGTLQSAFVCSLRLLPPLARNLVGPIPVDAQPCPVRDLYRNVFLGQDKSAISPKMARIALGVTLTSVASDAKLINQLLGEMNGSQDKPKGTTVAATGLTALAATAYDNLSSRILLFNLVPLAVVALVLLAIYRDVRRAFLPVLPAAVAAGWSALVMLAFGRLPGPAASALGTLNPLTVVLGALVIALGTEFGVVLLQRFYEERARGLEPDEAAGAALRGVGRAIVVSALTLAAGFGVLAVSGLFPGGLPLIADFGLAVLVDLALAVGAVFFVMLPMAVALERSRPLPAPAPARGGFERRPEVTAPSRREGEPSNRAAKRARDAARRATAVVEPEVGDDEDEETAAAFDRDPWGRPAAPAAPEPPAVAPVTPSGVRDEDVSRPDGSGLEDSSAAPEGPVLKNSSVVPESLPDTSADAQRNDAALRRFPSSSGRRRPPTPEAPVPPPPHRIPGVSGRRRPASTLPPEPTPAPPTPDSAATPATETPRRRMPGGVVRRPAAPTPAPPPTAAAEQPEQQPDTPRPRRRRPPPWVRRNLPPPTDD